MSPLIILALGGAAVMVLARKSGEGGTFYVFDSDCNIIVREINTSAQLMAFARRLGGVTAQAWTNLGFPMTTDEVLVLENEGDAGWAPTREGLAHFLGPAPGNPEINAEFARALITELVFLLAPQGCLDQLPAPATNTYGPDLFDQGAPMAVVALLQEGYGTMMEDLVMLGYDIGFEFTVSGPQVSWPVALAEGLVR